MRESQRYLCEITEETQEFYGTTYHRVRHLETGKLGGWVADGKPGDKLKFWVEEDARVHPGASLAPTVVVRRGALISTGVILCEGVIVEEYAYLGPRVLVGEDALIKTYAVVEKEAKVIPGAVVGSGARIPPGSQVPSDTRVKVSPEEMPDHCASCNAPIIWATNPKTGKRAPYDATPEGVGFVLHHPRSSPEPGLGDSYSYDGKREPINLLMGSNTHVFVNHFATCPSADTHRRKR